MLVKNYVFHKLLWYKQPKKKKTTKSETAWSKQV